VIVTGGGLLPSPHDTLEHDGVAWELADYFLSSGEADCWICGVGGNGTEWWADEFEKQHGHAPAPDDRCGLCETEYADMPGVVYIGEGYEAVYRTHDRNIWPEDYDDQHEASVKTTAGPPALTNEDSSMHPQEKVSHYRKLLRQVKAELRRVKTADNFQRDDFQEFFDGYVETALWSSHDESDESGGEPMDANYTVEDIADECLATMRQDCQKFFDAHYDLVENEIANETFRHGPDYGPWAHVGHDFWLTRNHHGAGFWDGDYSDDAGEILTEASEAFGEVDLYIGDDGQIYCQQG